MKKKTSISLLVAVIATIQTSNSSASWSKKSWNKRNWYDTDWNPYQVWCPRYWIKEMFNIFDDDYPQSRGYAPYGRYYVPYTGYYPYGRGYYSPVYMRP